MFFRQAWGNITMQTNHLQKVEIKSEKVLNAMCR